MNISNQEKHRPQFHFTSATGWLNDPNGLVYCDGEYHLFFQHNPHDTKWGNMTWGHAVSNDLLHWNRLPNALEPDSMGHMFSGSAVVDWQNTAGFGKEALVALYTAEGGMLKPPVPSTQCLAFSTDRGRTWSKYPGNPILPQITPGNRDPKVFWHEPTGRWIMVLYVAHDEKHWIQFFCSQNLKQWEFMSEVDGFYECPDLIDIDGRWFLIGADGRYAVGSFDGRLFTVESGLHTSDWGANYYAAQSFSDMPAGDGRRILVGWMRDGQYPGMPFSQQMTIPCELRVRDGLLAKWPVRELDALVTATRDTPEGAGELLDVEAVIEPGNCISCGFNVRGLGVSWLAGDPALVVGRNAAPLPPDRDGMIRLRLLIDRTSVEVFAAEGRVALSHCYLPCTLPGSGVAFFSCGGKARLRSLVVKELKSVWA